MYIDSFGEDFAISQKANIYLDEVYKNIFPIKDIIRFKKDENRHILDKDFHIDVVLELLNEIKLTGQEKALRKKFSYYDTFTIEFYQNRHTKERGEFFNLCSQFYSHGYVNADKAEDVTRFDKLYIIKIFDYFEWLKNKSIEELEKSTRPSSGYASFYYMEYNKIPSEFIYYNLWKTKNNSPNLI